MPSRVQKAVRPRGREVASRIGQHRDLQIRPEERLLQHADRDVPAHADQPMHLELVVNRQTAKALALTIPQSLLPRADRVIN